MFAHNMLIIDILLSDISILGFFPIFGMSDKMVYEQIADKTTRKRMIIADGRNAQSASGLTVIIRVRIISKQKAGSQLKPQKQLYPETCT